MKRNLICIHGCIALALFALWGGLETGNRYLFLCAALSFSGALCFTSIRLCSLLRQNNRKA